jgi:hypothetical protein
VRHDDPQAGRVTQVTGDESTGDTVTWLGPGIEHPELPRPWAQHRRKRRQGAPPSAEYDHIAWFAYGIATI